MFKGRQFSNGTSPPGPHPAIGAGLGVGGRFLVYQNRGVGWGYRGPWRPLLRQFSVNAHRFAVVYYIASLCCVISAPSQAVDFSLVVSTTAIYAGPNTGWLFKCR